MNPIHLREYYRRIYISLPPKTKNKIRLLLFSRGEGGGEEKLADHTQRIGGMYDAAALLVPSGGF